MRGNHTVSGQLRALLVAWLVERRQHIRGELPGFLEDGIDKVVIEALLKRLLKPERLNTLLARLLEKSEGADANRRQTIGTLRAERNRIERAIQFERVEAEDLEETNIDFKARLQKHQKRRSAIDEEIGILDRQLGSKSVRVNEATIAKFAKKLKAKLADPSDVELRKSYIRAFVKEVVMTKEQIIIRGPVAALSRAVTADDSDDLPVRSSVVDWCARQDSNLWPPD